MSNENTYAALSAIKSNDSIIDVGFKDSHSHIASPSLFFVLQTSAFQSPFETLVTHLGMVLLAIVLLTGNLNFIGDERFIEVDDEFKLIILGSIA